MNRRLLLVLAALLALTGLGSAKDANQNPAVSPVPREEAWWRQRHESINQRAKQGNVDLIFIGDSITQGWENAGKEVWAKYYASRKAMNLGISGDRTEHVLWRLENGNLDGLSPKAAVLMIGTNNTGQKVCTPEQIAEGITAIVKTLRTKMPQTKVLLLGIFPRGELPGPDRESNAKASELTSKIADGKMVHYMDIGIHFMTPEKKITREIMPDFLHLTPRGYEIWAIAIEGKLRELLGEKP